MATKKDIILQTAMELFTVKGFNATTTKEIATKCGVAEGLIFYYFKDKNELLRQLIHDFSFIGSFHEDVQGISEMEPYQALIQIGHSYAHFLSQNINFLTFIWSTEMVQNKDVSEKVVDLIQSMTELIAVHLIRAVARPVEKQKIEIAASMILSTLFTHFLVVERVKGEKTPENEHYIEDVVNLVLKGLD